MWSRSRARALAWVLAVVATLNGAVVYAGVMAAGGSDHQTADWLINDAGGLLRRSLFGAVYLRWFADGQAGLWQLFGVQTGLVVAVMAAGLVLLARLGWSWLGLAVLFGPAALPFWGWDPAAFGRKELVAVLALELLALGRGHRWLAWAGVVMWALAMASWEGAVFVLAPALFLAASRPRRLAVSVLAVAGLAWAVMFPGRAGQRLAVCAALRDKGLGAPTLCQGAVAYIGQTIGDAWAYVVSFAHLNVGYAVWLPVALAPLLATGWPKSHRLLAGASVLGFVAACAVGIDVGRWIALLVTGLGLCWAVEDDGTSDISGAVALAYVTLWGLPHAPYFDRLWPGLGLAHTLSEVLVNLR